MTFIIRTEADKLRAIDAIKAHPLLPVQHVTIKDYKRNRSLAQNDTFHQWVCLIAEHSGYSKDEVKDKLVLALWPPVERKIKVKNKDVLTEYTLLERRSTTSLSVEEMSQLLDATAQVAHTLNIKLPYSDEFNDSMKGK